MYIEDLCLRRALSECSGKERDQETGLDFFGYRYLSSAQGRWTAPDVPFADQQAEDPQSWNLYSYVRNRPLSFVDTNGRQTISALPEGSAQHRFFDVAVGAGKGFAGSAVSLLRALGANSATMDQIDELLQPTNARQAGVINLTNLLQDAFAAKSLIAGGIIVTFDVSKLIELEKVGGAALEGIEGRRVVSRKAFAELVSGSSLEKANALLEKFGIQKFFGIKNPALFEQTLGEALKLGLSPSDATILATAKAQGAQLATADKAMIEIAKMLGVDIAK